MHMSITESDYKNLNKNDIEDMYLLIINLKVDDYAKTGLLWSLSVFIKSIEKYKVFSIVSEPMYDIIYKNSRKEKRVMRHQEVHKFCDATLKRVLEGLKSYNNDALFDEDEEEFGELSLEVMEDEEVALVDGVFEGAFGVLSDKSWCFGDGVLLSS
ncbi:hypothetical protein Tco_0826449 [Tanacetum coccineum]